MKSHRSAKNLPLILDRSTATAPPAEGNFPGLTSTDRAPREEILHRAYAIWESEGHPQDRKLDNWLQAEAEVMGHA